MKKTLFTLAIATFSVCSFATTTTAELQTATVYQAGADLTHTAVFDLQKGENTIRIDGLSPKLSPQSVQVMLNNGVVISSFECKVDYLSSGKYNTQAQILRDSLSYYQAQLKSAASQVTTTQTMLTLLQKGIEGNFAATKQAPTTESIAKNLTYFQEQSLALHQQLTQQNTQVETLQKRIQAIEQQLKADDAYKPKRSGILTLNLNAPKAIRNARAQIKYFTRSASWIPQYDIHVTNINAPLSLLSKASVQQQTGLDWEKVRLTLSTYAPSTNNVAPEFTTWFLREPSKYIAVSYGKRYANRAIPAPSAVAESDIMMEEEEEEMETATVADYVTQSEQALSISYAIDIPYTILGNGKPQIIPLSEQQISTVEYEYFVAPKLNETAYLLANITDWEKLQLLNGMAGITYNGTYYGQTYLDMDNTEKALQLTLGTDSQIAIKREKVSDYSSERVFANTKTSTQTFRITVRNNKSTPATIRLEEQYPISTSKEITVKLTDQTTAWASNDTEKGILTYSLTLQAGETKELLIGYTVKAPTDWHLNL